MVRTLAWLKAATPEQIMAALPAEFYQSNPDLYRRSLGNNRAGFSPDGLMPAGAPAVVWQAIARFDPALAAAKVDIPATYQNTFAERAARGGK